LRDSAFGVIENPEPVPPFIPALRVFLRLLRNKQPFSAVEDQMISNLPLRAARAAEVLRAPKNEFRNKWNSQELFGLLFETRAKPGDGKM
jgi:hypothetical protein